MAEVLPQGWNTGLRRERERRGWTRKQLADHINGAPDSIYNWEERGAKPRPDMLQALIDLFGKPVEAWGRRIWQVPYLRNAYFTGRERALKELHTRLGLQALREQQYLPVALSQARAISGLGGIGKTQTAVEYARRFGREYDIVVLVHADSREGLIAELAGLASLLGLPTAETKQHLLAKEVKRWLEAEQELVWLLIFDNVDDLVQVKEFLPEQGLGAVLLTTRLQGVGKHIHKIDLDAWTPEEGLQFFQARLGSGEEPERKVLSEEEYQAAAELHTLLGGLPLAMEQAAAYMEEEECSLPKYLSFYQQQPLELLRRTSRIDQQEYPHSVATTWLLSFQRIEQASPLAADLLRALAFLHPDAIPMSLLLQGAAHLGARLQAVVEHPALLQQAIDLVQRYSLIRHHPKTDLLDIHRLVQAVLQDGLDETARRSWRERVVLAVNAAFPEVAQERWPECERLLPHALRAADYIEQEAITSEGAGRLLHETASYLQDRAQYAQAEPLFQRALQIREQCLRPEYLDVAASLIGLADLHREQGKFAEAEPRFQRALQIREAHLGPEHVLVAIALNNLANLYRDQGRAAEAEPLYLRARPIWEQYLSPGHPPTPLTLRSLASRFAGMLNNLGALYKDQGRYAEAETLYLRALDLLERYVGPESFESASPLSNLAVLYKEQRRYAEAEPLYQRALHLFELHLGPKHTQVALALNNLAELYRDQYRYAEAEPLYQRALTIYQDRLGPEHYLVAILLVNLADIYREQKRSAEAEPLFTHALALFEQSVGPGHFLVSYALNGLATLSREQGTYPEAEALYQRALHIREQAWGEQHPDTAETMDDLGQLWEERGTYEEARSWYARALAVRERTLGAHHAKTVETRQRLIALLHVMGRHEEATRLERAQPEQGPGKEA